MTVAAPILHVLTALVASPLLLGVIRRVKAWMSGRKGAPLLQSYYDFVRLMNKGAVYSRTTTWVFRAGPMVGLAAVLVALTLVPLGGVPALMRFQGDLVLFAALLGLLRFFYVLAALDTGSAFEGMGASREIQFSALAEPALLLGLAAMARTTHELSLSPMYDEISFDLVIAPSGAVMLVAVAFLIVFLTENSRLPIDDPNTHLELTMIHEVMVLDHSGPDLAFVEYTSALKLWVLGALLVGIAVPVRTDLWYLDLLAGVAGMFALAVVTGILESTMARLRLSRVPQFLVAAVVFSGLALVLVLR